MTSRDFFRSKVMRAIKSKNTTPELKIRKLAHAMGYRFRLHRKDLPGSPDIVFPKYRAVIFVHGCFWHGHKCDRGARTPKTNTEYWKAKIERNQVRDDAAQHKLREIKWRSLIIWECQIRHTDAVEKTIRNFLEVFDASWES